MPRPFPSSPLAASWPPSSASVSRVLSSRSRAATQANRTSLWMLFPTVGCFLVAAALVIIGPVFLEFRRQMEENAVLLREGLQDINKLRLPSKTLKAPPTAPAAPQATQP